MFRNTILNSVGLGLPLLIGIVVFPILMQEMGGERFGLLLLIWTMVGYFNLFDLGVSRALTRLFSIELAHGGDANSKLVSSGLSFLLAMGIAIGALLYSTSTILLSLLYSNTSPYYQEAINSINWIAISLPFILLSAGSVGLLETLNRFYVLNFIRIALGAMIFAMPLIIFSITRSLSDVACGLFFVRAIYCAVVLFMAVQPIRHQIKYGFDFKDLMKLFSFGIWITLSNIIGPIMLYGDRFLLASLSGVVLSGYYGVTLEILTKILLIPTAVLGAAFPVFSRLSIDKEKSIAAYISALTITIILVVLVSLFVELIGPILVVHWMNDEFVNVFAKILPFILIGIIFNSIGLVSQAFIQAANRPDITAKLHVIEVLLYIPYAYYLIHSFSVVGAASAWAIRTFLSMIALFYLSQKIIKVA